MVHDDKSLCFFCNSYVPGEHQALCELHTKDPIASPSPLEIAADALGALVDDAGYSSSTRPGYCFLRLRQEVWDAAVKAREANPDHPKYEGKP